MGNFLKTRSVPHDILVYDSLNVRMELSEDEISYYRSRCKGFEGEKQFDLWLEDLPNNWLIVNDLVLEHNNTKFQIDSLVICQRTIYVFEVKNLEGDYYFDGNFLFMYPSKKEIKNPLNQIARMETLLRQLLQKHGLNFPIQSSVVFVNPEFVLLQAQKDLPIIHPPQLNRLKKNLLSIPSTLSEKHTMLAEKLISLHNPKPSTDNIPEYSYAKVKKGVFCCNCKSLFVSVIKSVIVCSECGFEESVEDAILRNVEEIKRLFPEMRITTKLVHEWCGVVKCKRRVFRILMKHYKQFRKGKLSYFE
ncbi:nuclease-related domain-containing protein [Evansella sp. AB-rgal1]|uniref:nuclease-related domain-containing protein n=1 Tax=Evansella sp. AB-rgal1 TaxID=3242696 RepID=UPI00359CFF01